MRFTHVFDTFKVKLNENEMYYYQDIIDGVENIGYDDECIVDDVARRVGRPSEGYGLFDAKIIEENGAYYAIWKCYSSCD